MKKKERIGSEICRLKDQRLEKVLRRPGVSYEEVAGGGTLTPEEIRVVETEIKYEGFIKRQINEVGRLEKVERIRIPEDTDYRNIHGLSSEIKEKLSKIRPINLGQAARISGVTPAAVSILMVYLDKVRRSA